MKKYSMLRLSLVLVSVMTVLIYAQAPIPGNWMYDQNENKIDDRIETISQRHPDSLLSIIVDLRHPTSEMDANFLRNFGEVSYVMQHINSIALRRVQSEVAFSIAADIVGSAHSPPSQWRENGYSGGHGYCERSDRGEWDIYTYASWQFSKLLALLSLRFLTHATFK